MYAATSASTPTNTHHPMRARSGEKSNAEAGFIVRSDAFSAQNSCARYHKFRTGIPKTVCNGSETVERVRSWWRDRLYVVEGIVDDSAVSRPTVRLSFDIDDGTGFGGFVKRFDDPEVGECMLAVGFDRAIGE